MAIIRSTSVKPLRTFARIPLFSLVAIGLAIVGSPYEALAAKPSGSGRCPAGSQPLPKSGRCIIPVTTAIGDVDAGGLSADIRSDGLGPYPHNVSGVTSYLTSNGYHDIAFGDWQFGTYGSTSRLVGHSIDPEDAVQPGDPHYTAPATPPFWGGMPLTSYVAVQCTLVYRSMLTMTAGSSFTCPLVNRFNVGGIDYDLSPGQSFNHYLEVTDSQVRCNSADSGGCNDWSIDPIGLGQAVGRLVPLGTTINYGDFYLRFHIHVTRP